jgi:hypothetical protein
MRSRAVTFGTLRHLIAIIAAAVILAGISTAFKQTRVEVQDWDCPPPPASCARPVVVSGFPLPFISDYHGISAVGDANLVSAILGDDKLHRLPLLLDIVIYCVLLSIVRRLILRKGTARREEISYKV